jgi:hypothetical protein
MAKHLHTAPCLAMATAFAMSGATALAQSPLDEAQIFVELNHTDGDLGIHALIDGEAWEVLEIADPQERRLLFVRPRGQLARQGLTELFFESAEPPFEELSPEEFFDRFPEGEYRITGRTIGDEELQSTTEFSHVLPAPPDGIRLRSAGETQLAAENCDAADLPEVPIDQNLRIRWDAVTGSHPEIGEERDIEVVRYQVVVELEEPELLIYTVDLPSDVTAMKVPKEFLAFGEPGDEFKFEILVREASGNQTAIESCFIVT